MTKETLTASINLSKINKEHLYTNESGVKFLNLKLVFKGEIGEYGDIGFITQSPLKSKDENGDYINLEILGNIKPFPKKTEFNTTTSQAPEADDDFPF